MQTTNAVCFLAQTESGSWYQIDLYKKVVLRLSEKPMIGDSNAWQHQPGQWKDCGCQTVLQVRPKESLVFLTEDRAMVRTTPLISLLQIPAVDARMQIGARGF